MTIDPVNDIPSFLAGSNKSVPEDAGAQSVAGWATAMSPGPANESGQALTFFADTDNPGLFAVPPAVASDGKLTYSPAPNANGVATVTVHVHDDGGTANGGVEETPTQTFTVTVVAVNDAPSFSAGPDQTVVSLLGNVTVPNWASGISTGPANESSQNVSFVVSNDNPGLFATSRLWTRVGR